MDIKKNDPAEELRVLIKEWGYLNSEKTEIEKFNDILKFICQKYDEKDDNGWLKQISENPILLSELFEKNEDGSFKCSKGIEVVIDNKKWHQSNINDILSKIEKKDLNLGYEFLLNKDEKHTKLLVELNEKIRKWKILDNIKNQTPEDKKNLEKQIEDIAKFISNHYRTFVARLQQGVQQSLLNELFARDEKTGLFKYKKAHKFLKEAADRGLIFAVASYDTFLVDPNDENNKTLEIIAEKSGKEMWNAEFCNTGMDNIKVCAHAMGNFDETFRDKIYRGVSSRTLALIPLNDNFLSFISSRQTEGVENTCKIINYFTEKYFKQHNQRMNVTLDGASQGVDFITKMVGSTHGRGNTRIKNANINLVINAPHIFQDEQKIVNRLTNGAKNNNNTITNISIYNDMGKCVHPTCKTDNLIEWLKYYKQNLNNNVEIKDLRTLGSKQQHAVN